MRDVSVHTVPKELEFLRRLRSANIHFRLDQFRDNATAIDIAVPGDLWDVEFMEDGTVDVERFKSEGDIKGESELEILFKDFSD